MTWIRCADRLPEHTCYVLAVLGGRVRLLLYNNLFNPQDPRHVNRHSEFFSPNSMRENVTHWAPLPEPPEDSK